MATLLDLINAACLELGIPTTTLVVSSQDTQVKQLLALANREGREQVAAPVPWTQLQKVQTITLVNGQAAYNFPSDFNSYIPDTIWDPQQRWPVAGPISPQRWEYLKKGLINTQPWMRYRIWAGQIYFDPVPSGTYNGQTVTVEYQSNAFCQSAAGAAQSRWMNDSDVFLLPDDIMVLGLKWRFLASKRLDYSEEKKAWSDSCDRETARSLGLKSAPLNHIAWNERLYGVPEGDFPGPITVSAGGGSDVPNNLSGIISTTPYALAISYSYGLNSAASPLALNLPPLAGLAQGSFIELYDVSFNLAANNATIFASPGDTISLFGISAAFQTLNVSGATVRLVVGPGYWSMVA